MARILEIQLPGELRERLVQGHPWIYRNHVPPAFRAQHGAWLRLRCGSWTGYGLWDAEGSIAVRVYATHTVPDEALLAARVRAGWELRQPLREAGCTAYRWLFGEGDWLPGITVDRYGEYVALATYSSSVEPLLPAVIDGLRDCDERLRGIVQRADVLWGEAPPADLVVNEHGLRFLADLQGGQKTGLFLDQRENRRFVESISAGRTVLNCFAYTGAFSLYALSGGAEAVESVDIGKGLAEAAAANIKLSRLDGRRHRFVTADCFELLADYAEQGRTFDLVILDPPSFARNKQSRHAAERAYAKLNALGMRCVTPGGLLATASCTSQVSQEAFKAALAAAGAQAGRQLQIIHEAGQPLDHPVPAGFPEGRYLKFVVGRVMG
jgi:23S rRNA (cytosine1962-C5)-methyltransferase